MTMMGVIADNIRAIKDRIAEAARRAGRDPDSVRLVAVTKRKSVAVVAEALSAGQRLFGENYLQEAQEKIFAPELAGRGAGWHFIGHLQSNKAKVAAELFACLETLDSLKLAKALEKRLAELDRELTVLVQVNVGREAQKAGVFPEEAEQLCRELGRFPHLVLTGLMTMPPLGEAPEASRPYFRELRLLAEELAGKGLFRDGRRPELSMGMSGDFEVAVEEGATLVRVGTALFGERA
ncbi:YggS family pyridoxal phosphate-dependent enzyme [Thiovibrio sp. JS02]